MGKMLCQTTKQGYGYSTVCDVSLPSYSTHLWVLILCFLIYVFYKTYKPISQRLEMIYRYVHPPNRNGDHSEYIELSDRIT